MTESSRRYIMSRRAGGGTDLTQMKLTSGTLTLTDALKEGIWTINATQQIGIATSTEQGLTPDRFPVRVILNDAPRTDTDGRVTTAIRYWRATNLAGVAVPYSRRPIADTTVLENLYKVVPTLDDKMWEFQRQTFPSSLKLEVHADLTKLSDEIYALLLVQAQTSVTGATVHSKLDELVNKATALVMYPFIKISADHLIVFQPHGYTPSEYKGFSSAHIPTAELYLNIKLNTQRMAARHGAEALPEGTYATAGYAVASMFRFGLFEYYESREFYTAYVSPLDGSPGKFTISKVVAPRGLGAPADLSEGSILDVSDVKVDRKLLEIGPGLCIAAGLNHYMFNHTTGGTIATGPLLTFLAMFGLIKNDMERKVAELVTTVFYESLHPVNKRAVANLFFKKSRVTTHGRLAACMRYEQFKPDDFLTIRLEPQPAGAHKAYVCAAALKRVVQGGLAPFLPWANSINDCISICNSVLHGGASSHIGAMYYTGRHGLTQSSSLDNYLPEVACYMVNIARNDTLTMSPHLSQENAARASLGWQNLVKDLKGEEFVSTDPLIVRRYLTSQGKVYMDFDITKEDQWGKAAEMGANALAAIVAALE